MLIMSPTEFCAVWQEKLVLRVQTANDEVAHLKDFDYGKPCWAH